MVSVTSLKNDKNKLWGTSIVWRLTLLYTFSVSLLLITIVAFFYEELSSNLREEEKQLLAEKVHFIRTVLQRSADNRIFFEEEIRRGVRTEDHNPYFIYFIRILEPQGSVLIETPGMAKILPASIFPIPFAEKNQSNLAKKSVNWDKADGNTYLLLAAKEDMKPHTHVIQLAMDISREDTLLQTYEDQVMIIIPLGILILILLGIFISYQGLEPVRRISQQMQCITASRLHKTQGLNSDSWPSELIELADSFDKMLERLNNSFARLNQFSADLAHELRTPIHNLMGEFEVALMHTRSEAEYRSVLESGLEECSRLTQMIASLLFLARADNTKVPLRLEQIDVRRELEEIRFSYEAVAEEKSVKIECEGESSLPADRILLQRAIVNLLSNAIYHTPTGGKILMAVETSQSASGVIIRVSDSGCGIAREHLSKVFDRFYRVDSARTDGYYKIGLGLPIIQSIMELHGGTINIDSQLDKGTTVTLHFPIKQHLHNNFSR